MLLQFSFKGEENFAKLKNRKRNNHRKLNLTDIMLKKRTLLFNTKILFNTYIYFQMQIIIHIRSFSKLRQLQNVFLYYIH